MKAHTSQFKENIKTVGRQLDSIITYELDGVTQTLTTEELNSVTPTYQGAILKSVMKELDIDSNVDIPVGTILRYQFGVLVDDEYEYLDFGNYVVYSSEKQEDTRSYKIICYDKMLYSMKTNEDLGITYPISVRDYINTLCNKLGLEFKNKDEEFANYNRQITSELYVGLDYTYRDMFDELAQVTASTICLDNDDKVEIRYISNESVDTFDEEFLKDVNVTFGDKYGKVNSIVLSRSAESDNVYLQDEESVETNGLCELKIIDNQIMNFNDRADYLPDILEKLNGLEYYINDFASTGITYLELCDRYNIQVGDNIYSCVMLNDEILVTQGLVENVYTEMSEETETDYAKADKDDRKINQVYLIVNKQEGEIEALISKTKNIDDFYTKEQINKLILNSESGLTNIFKSVGGNNLLKNSALYFKTNDTYDYWTGSVEKIVYSEAQSNTAIKLKEDTFKQSVSLANGDYTLSFKYKCLNELGSASVKINNEEYSLVGENEFVNTLTIETNQLELEFSSSLDDSYIIYDLMLNIGTEASTWSQYQNEVHTDTVNISKGIEVEATENDTKATMNADGFNVINKNTSANVLKATDTGIETTDVKADKGTIGGMSVKKVQNQSWIVGV